MKSLLLLLLISYSGIVNTTDSEFVGDAVAEGIAIIGISPESVIIVETPAHSYDHRNYLDEMNGTYYLYIETAQRRSRALRVIAHELVHIEQYERGDLVKHLDGSVTWKGETYDVNSIERLLRPWEAEAEQREYRLQRKIKQQLK